MRHPDITPSEALHSFRHPGSELDAGGSRRYRGRRRAFVVVATLAAQVGVLHARSGCDSSAYKLHETRAGWDTGQALIIPTDWRLADCA
jgi:hypothetical protein